MGVHAYVFILSSLMNSLSCGIDVANTRSKRGFSICNDGGGSYVDQTGSCQCAPGWEGPLCQTEMSTYKAKLQAQKSLEFYLQSVGLYTDADIPAIHGEFTQLFSTINTFHRVFVEILRYEQDPNLTKLHLDVFYISVPLADVVHRTSMNIFNVTTGDIPIVIEGKLLTFDQASPALVKNTADSQLYVGISSEMKTNTCYIYDVINACENKGKCLPYEGKPACMCTLRYSGQFCEIEVKRGSDRDKETLAILFPVVAVALCVFFVLLFFITLHRVSMSKKTKKPDWSNQRARKWWTEMPDGTVRLPRLSLEEKIQYDTFKEQTQTRQTPANVKVTYRSGEPINTYTAMNLKDFEITNPGGKKNRPGSESEVQVYQLLETGRLEHF
ncbi:uncharacterized protein LOC128236085 isoform X1 [Mya arenaria]|uniref:uncharacterized protein LOC128236085 isoform X1 n=1 Tax=Mya arenaria TaxID=6604 RepID=UPI0022E3B96B|nr:uncharacterized protein LOC128236085 isoform X1 [Mya arenaria]XP_052806891.1 uncharacterized protein LOC128236085 isoform X1 [Mya arenaria]